VSPVYRARGASWLVNKITVTTVMPYKIIGYQ
jgi:hypothetical protein